jgi:hypothetical protein
VDTRGVRKNDFISGQLASGNNGNQWRMLNMNLTMNPNFSVGKNSQEITNNSVKFRCCLWAFWKHFLELFIE